MFCTCFWVWVTVCLFLDLIPDINIIFLTDLIFIETASDSLLLCSPLLRIETMSELVVPLMLCNQLFLSFSTTLRRLLLSVTSCTLRFYVTIESIPMSAINVDNCVVCLLLHSIGSTPRLVFLRISIHWSCWATVIWKWHFSFIKDNRYTVAAHPYHLVVSQPYFGDCTSVYQVHATQVVWKLRCSEEMFSAQIKPLLGEWKNRQRFHLIPLQMFTIHSVTVKTYFNIQFWSKQTSASSASPLFFSVNGVFVCVLGSHAHARVYGCVYPTVSLEFPGEQINWQPFAIIDFYLSYTHAHKPASCTHYKQSHLSLRHTHKPLADNKAAGRREGWWSESKIQSTVFLFWAEGTKCTVLREAINVSLCTHKHTHTTAFGRHTDVSAITLHQNTLSRIQK